MKYEKCRTCEKDLFEGVDDTKKGYCVECYEMGFAGLTPKELTKKIEAMVHG